MIHNTYFIIVLDCLTHYYHTQISNGIVSFTCVDAECERMIPEDELFLFIDTKNNNNNKLKISSTQIQELKKQLAELKK